MKNVLILNGSQLAKLQKQIDEQYAIIFRKIEETLFFTPAQSEYNSLTFQVLSSDLTSDS